MAKKFILAAISLCFSSLILAQFNDVPENHWARPSILRLSSIGIFSPNKTFSGSQSVTNYQLATILDRYNTYIENKIDSIDLSDLTDDVKELKLDLLYLEKRTAPSNPDLSNTPVQFNGELAIQASNIESTEGKMDTIINIELNKQISGNTNLSLKPMVLLSDPQRLFCEAEYSGQLKILNAKLPFTLQVGPGDVTTSTGELIKSQSTHLQLQHPDLPLSILLSPLADNSFSRSLRFSPQLGYGAFWVGATWRKDYLDWMSSDYYQFYLTIPGLSFSTSYIPDLMKDGLFSYSLSYTDDQQIYKIIIRGISLGINTLYSGNGRTASEYEGWDIALHPLPNNCHMASLIYEWNPLSLSFGVEQLQLPDTTQMLYLIKQRACMENVCVEPSIAFLNDGQNQSLEGRLSIKIGF